MLIDWKKTKTITKELLCLLQQVSSNPQLLTMGINVMLVDKCSTKWMNAMIVDWGGAILVDRGKDEPTSKETNCDVGW